MLFFNIPEANPCKLPLVFPFLWVCCSWVREGVCVQIGLFRAFLAVIDNPMDVFSQRSIPT